MGLKIITKLELERLSKELGNFENVLDVGCGNQLYKKFISCKNYVGIDVEVSGHSSLFKKVDKFFDGKSIPFPNNYFDFILCSEVLEHALEPIDLVKEMRRVLKINGVILLTVPSMWGEHETPYDFRRYTSFGIKKLAKDVNLKILNFKKEDPGILSFLRLGLSEINASKSGRFKKTIAKFWIYVLYFVLKKLLNIEMPRIYLSNIITLSKKN